MQVFKKILCPVDFSDYSRLALRYAAALANENDAMLVVYHCIPDLTQALSYLEGNYWGTVAEALSTTAKQKMDDFVHKILPSKFSPVVYLGSGSPAEEILKIVEERDVDLIVMGTHGHTGYERFLMGSVTNRVLHKTSIPVLVVCKQSHHFISDDREHPVEIHKILCAVQFEADSLRIAKTALSLARTYGASITFLHALAQNETEKEAQARLLEIVDPAAEESCKVQFLVVPGEAGELILRTIQDKEIDLLIMGHHSRRPIEELFLGSVAKRMVTDSRCPVLVIRSSSTPSEVTI